MARPIKSGKVGLDCFSDIVEYNTSLQVFRFLMDTPITTTKIAGAAGVSA